MRIRLTASAPRVDLQRRMIAGTVFRYGEVGLTSRGPLRVRAGAQLRFPANLGETPLTREHDRDAVRGHVALIDDGDERLYVAIRVVDGEAGDQALAEALDRGPNGRGGLSFDLENVVIEGDEIVEGDVVAIGQVHDPAFNSARIDQIAASRPTSPAHQGTPTGGNMTPEQIARLAALRAQTTRTAEEETELAELAALEAAQAEPTTPADQDPPAAAPQSTPAAQAPAAPSPAAGTPVAASIPAVPAGVPTPGRATTRPQGGAFHEMARRVVDEWRRSGDLARGLTAALQDIVESSHDVIEQPAWSGELWSGLRYEPIWTDLFTSGPLTYWKGEGWRFTSKLEIQDYAGDKAEIPTDNVTTEASNYEAARMAVGVDIDRKFYDFPNEGFVTSLFEQIRESWEEKLDNKVRAYAVANAAKATRTVVVSTTNGDATVEAPDGSFTAADVGRSISGAGIPAATTILSVTDSGTIEMSANATATASGVAATVDSADTSLLRVVGRLNQSAVRTKLGRLTAVVVNDEDYFDLMDVTEQNAPKWLTEFVGDPTKFRPDPSLARGTAYGLVRQAATLRTLPGSPIRVSAQNIANGGVDEAAFGYWAIEEHHTAGILKATYLPA